MRYIVTLIFLVHCIVCFVGCLDRMVVRFTTQGQCFSPDTPVSSPNKNYRHDIAGILLKVVLNTITLMLTLFCALCISKEWYLHNIQIVNMAI
jgi:hypothetical protein